MKISEKDWKRFANTLGALSDKAMKEAAEALASGDLSETEAAVLLKRLADKYGEAAAAYAAEMYDSLATASHANVAAAEAAAVKSEKTIAAEVKRTDRNKWAAIPYKATKAAAVNTMLKNARRDNAEAAWITAGGACPFCMMISSRGWEKAKEVDKRTRHIHEHCRCMYAVRFDTKSSVGGYDPDALKEKWDNLSDEGYSGTTNKLNAWRRELAAAERAKKQQ